MKDYRPDEIRTVVLLSHGGHGKTSLAEGMLYAAGATNRLGTVPDGTTAADFDPDEVKRQVSINLAILPLEWGGVKVNIIDAPGYADFVGETKGAIRAADSALIVVCAASGVQVGTDQSWGYAEEVGLPRMVVLNRMDRENANFAQALAQLQQAYGARCVPAQLPIGAQASFRGVVDLLTRRAYEGESGEGSEPPAEMASPIVQHRERLVEAIAETDDALITKYLEGEELTEDELRAGLRRGVLNGSIVPVFAASGTKVIGLRQLLDCVMLYAPSPVDRPGSASKADDPSHGLPLTADPSGPLAAQVFKTTADPYVGKLTYFRVFSGTLSSDSHVWNSSKGADERVGQLFTVRGKSQEQVKRVVAGDIGAVAKLGATGIGDTLCQREHPLLLPPIPFPAPIYSLAVHPKSKADLDKLGTALTRLSEEDPTLRVQRDPGTNETLLAGLGDAHIEVAVERMRRKFGVEVELSVPKVPYRETITTRSQFEYTHKKQTGGHGQYARVAIALEPLPRGEGFQFQSKIVGGVVPRQYISAVEKGVQEAMQDGVVARYPMVDMRVTLYDGKDHPVDSSEIAFKIAAAAALRQGASQARPVLLEPIYNLEVRVPEAFVGDIISDLNTKRAKVLGTGAEGAFTVISTQAPLAELQRYSADLRSLTQGRASYTMAFSHYELVPDHIAKKIVEESRKDGG